VYICDRAYTRSDVSDISFHSLQTSNHPAILTHMIIKLL
jgi:hypothetical protein